MDGTLDHTMMRVEDLDASLAWYSDHLGYVEHSRWEADTFTNVFLGPADPHDDAALLELTYNHDGRSYTHGDGWGHLAIRCADVYEGYESLIESGVEEYRDPDSCGGSYAFVRDPDGHEIELVERDHGARWSLDHTMLRVEDADETIGWLARKLEYDLVRRAEFDSFSLYFMQPGHVAPEAMSLELTINHDDRTYDVGDSWGHVAPRVDDLEADWEAVVGRGALDYRDPASCDYQYAFTKLPGEQQIELVRG